MYIISQNFMLQYIYTKSVSGIYIRYPIKVCIQVLGINVITLLFWQKGLWDFLAFAFFVYI